MQSTGQTSTHASQPVQLSARTTASSLGSFFLALPAPSAIPPPHSASGLNALPRTATRKITPYILSWKPRRKKGPPDSPEPVAGDPFQVVQRENSARLPASLPENLL